jgi:hypothetical protein
MEFMVPEQVSCVGGSPGKVISLMESKEVGTQTSSWRHRNTDRSPMVTMKTEEELVCSAAHLATVNSSINIYKY